jgi:hypothetical protein
VIVNAGVTADILMENLTIDVSGVKGVVDNACAFQIMPGAKVVLRLAGESSLKSIGTSAAIEVPAGAELTITSALGDGSPSGSLEAVSEQGAAIGGGSGLAGGSITINGGTIQATSNSSRAGKISGAGIGGGANGNCGTIVINGGTVNAHALVMDLRYDDSLSGAAGIGGGSGGNGGKITISGGAITATCGTGATEVHEGGAGIGGGAGGIGGEISIDGGVVTADGGYRGAGIGGGKKAADGTNISIKGGILTAKGGYQGAGIGSGSDSGNKTIAISGGTVTATGGGQAAGIGGGNQSSGNVGNITISGGTITARGVNANGAGAGIGSGYSNAVFGGRGASVPLPEGIIQIQGGTITATSDVGAGIGGGEEQFGGDIKISGGVVVASTSDTGAPIGPGSGVMHGGVGGTITLSGGTVFGFNEQGASIGKSNSAPNKLFDSSVTLSGSLILLAPSGVYKGKDNGDTTYASSTEQGILMGSDVTYTSATQTFTLNADLTIPNGKTLTIPRGYHINRGSYTITGDVIDMNDKTFVSHDVNGSWTLTGGDGKAELISGFYIAHGETLTIASGQTVTIPSGLFATNDGTIVVEGTLKVDGTLKNRGLVWYKSGSPADGIVNAPDGFNMGGTLTQSGGSLTVGGIAPLDGFTIGQGQTLNVPSGATAVVRGIVSNDGAISVAEGGTLLVYGTLANTNTGTITNAGTLDNKGTINNSGTVTDSGTFVNEQGAIVNNIFTSVQMYQDESIPFALIHVTGTLDNYGTVNNFGTIWVDGTFVNEVDGAVSNAAGALIRITGCFINHGYLKNRGTIDITEEGLLENTGRLDNTGGTINDEGTYTDKTVPDSDDATPPVVTVDITQSPVTVKDAAGKTIATARMTLRDDGVWMIDAPAGTDLSALALTFTLPEGVTIRPSNGSLQDFSGGRTVLYFVTSGSSTKIYEVGLSNGADDHAGDDATDPNASRNSTDITKGSVTVTNEDRQTIAEGSLELQTDGTWRIDVPDSADISKVALTFDLPDDDAIVVPGSDAFFDFSGGKIVKYCVISANYEKFKVYQIGLSGGLSNFADSAEEDAAESSTDITQGLVILRDEEGRTIAEELMTQQSGGLWVITVPVDTDLSCVALEFTLPYEKMIVVPMNGSLQDFSDGKTVRYYVISANGQHYEPYNVQLLKQGQALILMGMLLRTDQKQWKLTETSSDSGVTFILEAPLAIEYVPIASIDVVEEPDLGGTYSDVKLIPTFSESSNTRVQPGTPVLRITGTAEGVGELGKLSISRVDWTLTDGSKWYQIVTPIVYADLVDTPGDDDDDDGNGNIVHTDSSGGSSGCATVSWQFVAVLYAAGLLLVSLTKRR